MSSCCGCRVTQHLKEWDSFSFSIPSSSSPSPKFHYAIKPHNHNHHHKPSYIQKFLPLQTQRNSTPTRLLTKTNTCWFSSSSSSSSSSYSSTVGTAFAFINSCYQSKFPRELPILSDPSFSQKEDDREISSDGLAIVTGGIVALGKFDALHIGHRELAIRASKIGAPFLLSFVGMAEVLGWAPRAPIVAKCDRERVLSSWAPFCGDVSPKEILIDFAGVRHLTPREFVEKLSKELGVRGVVAGENYRFGYKAAGDASELVRLCDEYGMEAYIINSVMDKNQDLGTSCPPDKKERGQVSSTRVRYALGKGDMSYVSELLGRDHRLILSTENKEEYVVNKNHIYAPKSYLLNLPPKEGLYEDCSLIIGDDEPLSCRVIIDTTHIHIESDDKEHQIHLASCDPRHLSIEFRG